MIIRRLTKLRKEYDPLGYGGLVDPDMVTGSPRSVLAIASAIARGDGNDKVSEEHVRHALIGVANSREETSSKSGVSMARTSAISRRERCFGASARPPSAFMPTQQESRLVAG